MQYSKRRILPIKENGWLNILGFFLYRLLRKAASIGNLSDEYRIDIIPVPNTTGFDGNSTEGVVTQVSSEYLRNFIEERSIYIPEEDLVENVDPNEDDTTNEDNTTGQNNGNTNEEDQQSWMKEWI